MSEDDIRTKVVFPWLVSRGFNPAELVVEFTFEVRLGRNTHRVGAQKPSASEGEERVARPRADVLVRRGDANLFVVEVKAPCEPVDDEARDQGISYARLLPRIAPFVVVTNGEVTRIYDAISREEITGAAITPDHPSLKAGYRISGDELAIRVEALEAFVSLSLANLLVFCERQLDYRMRRLRDDDPATGKKYIPALYVHREGPRKRLEAFLDGAGSHVVAVTGKPQVGKTNFLCRFAEDRVRAGRPTLFYPAVSLDGSLLAEIAEDFGWLLGEQSTVAALVSRLGRVLARSGKKLTIVVDGWNEADVELARAIDRECERVQNQPAIQVVISFTGSAAKRLLTHSGNPSFLAAAAGIGLQGCELLESDPTEANRQRGWSSVAIEPYDADERAAAYGLLAKQFGVTVPATHTPVSDPYLLGVAMRHFAGRHLPDDMDEPELIRAWLEARVGRYTFDEFDVRAAALELGRAMLTGACPLPEHQAKKCWGLAPVTPVPARLPETAVFAFLGGSAGRFVDFYNSRDRDYVIACWVGGWPEMLTNKAELWEALGRAASSRAGIDAIAWFFGYVPFLRAMLDDDGTLPDVQHDDVRRLFLVAVRQASAALLGCFPDGEENEPRLVASDATPRALAERWAEQCGAWVGDDPDPRCRVESVKLLVSLVDDRDELMQSLAGNDAIDEVVRGLLEVHEDYPLEAGGLGGTVLEVFRQLHMDLSTGYDDTPSQVTAVLEAQAEDPRFEIREAAYAAWGDLRPRTFITDVIAKLPGRAVPDEYHHGISNALEQIEAMYHGDPWGMCPSYLSMLQGDGDGDRALGHWQEESKLANILSRFSNIPTQQGKLRSVLDDLEELVPPETLPNREPERRDAIGQLYLFDINSGSEDPT